MEALLKTPEEKKRIERKSRAKMLFKRREREQREDMPKENTVCYGTKNGEKHIESHRN